MCTRDNKLFKPKSSAQSQSRTDCRLLDPWKIEIYHLSHYSWNIFLFYSFYRVFCVLCILEMNSNQFLLPLFFIEDYLFIEFFIYLRLFHLNYF